MWRVVTTDKVNNGAAETNPIVVRAFLFLCFRARLIKHKKSVVRGWREGCGRGWRGHCWLVARVPGSAEAERCCFLGEAGAELGTLATGQSAVSVTGSTRLWTQDDVIFNSAAPGVLLAGAGALFCGIKYNSPLCLEAGSILHDSPERSESFLCARVVAVQLSRRMEQIGLNRKLYGFSFVFCSSG